MAKEYIKNDNTLVKFDEKILYRTSLPSANEIAALPNGTLLFIEGYSIFQKRNGSLVSLVGLGKETIYIGEIRPVYKFVYYTDGNRKNVPEGWLPCKGQSISKAEFPLIAPMMKEDPSHFDRFLLPDYSQCTPFGISNTDYIGQIQKYNIKHKHTLNDPGHTHSWVGGDDMGLDHNSYTQLLWRPNQDLDARNFALTRHIHSFGYDGSWPLPQAYTGNDGSYWNVPYQYVVDYNDYTIGKYDNLGSKKTSAANMNSSGSMYPPWWSNSYNQSAYGLNHRTTNSVTPVVSIDQANTNITTGQLDTSDPNLRTDTQPHGPVMTVDWIIKAY